MRISSHLSLDAKPWPNMQFLPRSAARASMFLAGMRSRLTQAERVKPRCRNHGLVAFM